MLTRGVGRAAWEGGKLLGVTRGVSDATRVHVRMCKRSSAAVCSVDVDVSGTSVK